MARVPYLEKNKPRQYQFRKPRRAKLSGVIVVHTAESVMDTVGPDTGAENVAKFIQNRADYGSYHDLCDSDSIVPLVDYDAEAYGDGTGSNYHALHLSFACRTTDWERMSTKQRQAFLKQGAKAAAQMIRWLKAEKGITVPLKKITKAASDRRQPGFLGHGDRDPERRTDPGARFPWNEFFAYLRAEFNPQPAKPVKYPPRVVTFVQNQRKAYKAYAEEVARLRKARKVARGAGEPTKFYTLAIEKTLRAIETTKSSIRAAKKVKKR